MCLFIISFFILHVYHLVAVHEWLHYLLHYNKSEFHVIFCSDQHWLSVWSIIPAIFSSHWKFSIFNYQYRNTAQVRILKYCNQKMFFALFFSFISFSLISLSIHLISLICYHITYHISKLSFFSSFISHPCQSNIFQQKKRRRKKEMKANTNIVRIGILLRLGRG